MTAPTRSECGGSHPAFASPRTRSESLRCDWSRRPPDESTLAPGPQRAKPCADGSGVASGRGRSTGRRSRRRSNAAGATRPPRATNAPVPPARTSSATRRAAAASLTASAKIKARLDHVELVLRASPCLTSTRTRRRARRRAAGDGGSVRRPQGAQGRDRRDCRRARPGQAREGGAPRTASSARSAWRPTPSGRPLLRAVRPPRRLRLVRRRAPGVPQLPRDDHYAHDDRELELGKPTNDITGRMGRGAMSMSELVVGGCIVTIEFSPGF